MHSVSKVIFSLIFVWVQVSAQYDYDANLDVPITPYSSVYNPSKYSGDVDAALNNDGDGSGTIYGAYAYTDPTFAAKYASDSYGGGAGYSGGYHPSLSHAVHDTEAVKQAKLHHFELFHKIAKEHAAYKHNPEYRVDGHPKDTPAVKVAKAKHLSLWEKIAAEHAKLGAEKHALDAISSYTYQPDHTNSYY